AGPSRSAPIVIGDGAWIAARVTILPGVTIGAGAIIGAGSVVTRDVSPHTLAVGNPARVVRRLNAAEPGISGPDDRASARALEAH
ncbi:MAG: DapH/DapD/GlmU-related protein, partial [Myxococcaceae bacterium]